MFLQPIIITRDSFAADIVKQDYRTAIVFRKHEIEFCCGGRWPLSIICETKGLDLEDLIRELRTAIREIRISSFLPFEEWSVDFLTDYILHTHHRYLKDTLPHITAQLEKFIAEHLKKYPYLAEVKQLFDKLSSSMLPHLQQEEEILFPYIRQIAHAYQSKESYASLLVRTLRKPVEHIMQQEHDVLVSILSKLRSLTSNYTAPENGCTSHRVSFLMLQELDNDLMQHLYLENSILFPKAIKMEKELLQR
jgi:regulator of cell morphogenesis and NO signaling